MAEPCTVLIGAPELLPALQERAGQINGEVIAFPDTDALRALDTISKRRPHFIVLERLFSVSPRGTALINRIKADKGLRQAEIRVFAHDSDYTRVVPNTPPAPANTLDQRGTRRAPRVTMAPKTSISVDGRTSVLVDLSAVGAQVISPVALKPNQQVAVSIVDDAVKAFCSANVAWTKFEMPDGGGAPVYRAGLDFVEPDANAIDGFAARHKA